MLDLKDKLESTLRATMWGVIAASAAVATMFFLCVAVFVWTGQNYGPVTACLVLAVIFLFITTGAAISLLAIRRGQAQRAVARKAAASEKWWLEPAVIAAGLQVGRIVSARPVVPLLVLVILLAGWMLNRSPAAENPAPPR
jgi:hypothetical protein